MIPVLVLINVTIEPIETSARLQPISINLIEHLQQQIPISIKARIENYTTDKQKNKGAIRF